MGDEYAADMEAREEASRRELRMAEDEMIIDGFEQLPRALIQLFEGVNIGKMMVNTNPG